MQLHILSSITEVSQTSWDALFDSQYPFCRYAFLHALEQGGSVDTATSKHQTGWQTMHLLLKQDDTLIAIMPAYLKQHSYGEYFFDWQFAKAYQQYQLPFYPKLINAIPFTPAQGPRIAIAPGAVRSDVLTILQQAIRQLMLQLKLSQFQSLYVAPDDRAVFQTGDYLERYDVQFQWHNNHYLDFNAFLAALSSRKRKQIRKERSVVEQQGVVIKTLSGTELDADFWSSFYQFYCATYFKRSGHQGYISLDTFTLWGQHLADSIVVFAAYAAQQLVAASLCFRSDDTLYGRYWGCSADYDRLHFECCYYSGIEYCIAQQLSFFDAGAQGEHKLQRGFKPVVRHAFYDIAPTMLSEAVTRYCNEERQSILQYVDQASDLLPFAKKADN